MKGQHGISIIAPAPYKKKTQQEVQDPRTGKPVLGPDGRLQTKEVEITVPHFKVSKIFDISQTRGEPLPELDVSDVLAVTKGGISTAYYVDSEKLITLNSFFHVPASNAVLT